MDAALGQRKRRRSGKRALARLLQHNPGVDADAFINFSECRSLRAATVFSRSASARAAAVACSDKDSAFFPQENAPHACRLRPTAMAFNPIPGR